MEGVIVETPANEKLALIQTIDKYQKKLKCSFLLIVVGCCLMILSLAAFIYDWQCSHATFLYSYQTKDHPDTLEPNALQQKTSLDFAKKKIFETR